MGKSSTFSFFTIMHVSAKAAQQKSYCIWYRALHVYLHDKWPVSTHYSTRGINKNDVLMYVTMQRSTRCVMLIFDRSALKNSCLQPTLFFSFFFYNEISGLVLPSCIDEKRPINTIHIIIILILSNTSQ